MGTGYTRNDSTNNIANGNVINASDLDGEFDAIQTAFSTSGHTHDGTAAEGGVITVVGPAQEFLGDGTAWYPKTDATYDLGKSTASFDVAFVESINLAGTVITSSATEINKLDGVTASTTEINYIDGVTSNIQTQLGTKLPLAGGTMTGNLSFGDNNKAIFGAGSDLQIYHTGSASRIQDTGTGNLYIAGTNLQLTDSTITDNYLQAVSGGALTIYHSGDAKLATTSTGVSVTGNVAVSGTVDGIDIASRDGILTSTTTTANAALPKAGGAMTGAITTNSTFDGRNVSVDGSKLDGIESGATADQSNAEIRAAVEAATDSNVFTDADHSKLNGIEASADVTDTTNVVSALTAGSNITIASDGTISGSASYTHPNHTGEVTSSGDGATTIASNVVDADNLKVTGNGSSTQFLRSDGDGTFTWATPVDTNTTYSVGDGGLTTNDFTNADHTKLDGIATSANNYTHPNHSGEVTSTGDGATVIADNVVDEANLKVSNTPTNGYVLTAQSGNTGGLTWAESAGAGAVGGGSDEVFFENGQNVTSNYTITNGKNAMSAGPITINTGVTVTVGSGEIWTVV